MTPSLLGLPRLGTRSSSSARLLASWLAIVTVVAASIDGVVDAWVVDAWADATSAEAVKAADPKPAEAKPGVANAERKNGRPRELPTFTPEREAAALTFVTAHHPELAPLLAGLKLSRPNEYQRAIRKLFADSERLAMNRENQPKQYELKLQEWKLESRIQLLVARLTMDRTPDLEAQLRAALEEQVAVHRELLMQERERTQQKIAGLDREINAIDADGERVLKERFNRAINSAGQKKQNLKPSDANKNGEAKSSDAKNSDLKNTDTKKGTP